MIINKGFPEEGEFVFCTVTKIFGHAVFVKLEEYDKQGMINISEVSPGRIRNLRDFVVENKKIVCVVLRVNTEKGHIDLSLRRVNENQKRKKLDEIKQEQKAEKIVENIAKDLKKDPKQLYEEVVEKIRKEYHNLSSCFTDVVDDKANLVELGLPKDVAEKLSEIVKQKMKPPKVVLSGKLSLKTYAPDGVEKIKDALLKARESAKNSLSIKYAGNGTYNLSVESLNYKDCEKILEKAVDIVTKDMEKIKAICSFKKK